jgi:pyruvate/2-oxoglutarate dehydrogenase complex dihydrolipoamide dehydrogenase (E3) component
VRCPQLPEAGHWLSEHFRTCFVAGSDCAFLTCLASDCFVLSAVGDVSIDVSKMMANKAKAVKGLTGGIESLFKKYKVTYVKGFGRIAGPQSISVDLLDGGKQSIEANKIVIATGSEVSPLPPVPVDNARGKIVDSTGALDLKEIPKSLAVIGGGVIGLEMGSVWRRLGAKVTVIEFLDRIVPATDLETGRNFLRILKKQGFDFKLSTKVVASEVTKDGVKLKLEAAQGGNAEDFVADVVLVSTGRRPFTKGFGLEELGVNMDRLGRIQVNEHFQTNVPSIYAIGDCIEGPMLAHKAEEEGIACVENFAGFAGHVNYDVIPSVVYTHPELATVGKYVPFCPPSLFRVIFLLFANTCMTLLALAGCACITQDRGAAQGGWHSVQQGQLPVRREQPRSRCGRQRGLDQGPVGQGDRPHSGCSHHRPERWRDDC